MVEEVKILAVDDEDINIRLIKGILRDCPLDVHAAANGEEALEKVGAHEYALILLDVMMPGMNGFEFAEQLRKLPGKRRIPIIFVTAISKEMAHVFRGYELGAVDYMFKPLEPEVLKGKVEIFAEMFRQHKKLERTAEVLKLTVAELQQAQNALLESEKRYRTVAEYNYDWECWHGPDGKPVYISPSCERITGYTREQFMNDSELLEKIVHPEDLPAFLTFTGNPDSGDLESLDFRVFHRNSRVHWLSIVRQNVLDEKGVSLGVRSSLRDITSRKLMEQELRHRALHDSLTGLANRTLFLNRLKRAGDRSEVTGKLFAVVFLDLDRFKTVNDSLGHSFGDKFLVEIGRRLKSSVRVMDTVARFGGDEFAVLAEEFDSTEQAEEFARGIRDCLRQTVVLDGVEMRTSASIGVHILSGEVQDREEVLQDAHMAMYEAKNTGKDRWHLFNSEMRNSVVRAITIEHELLRAIQNDEFELYFQPILNLRSGAVVGFESLIRWNHPERGLVGPGDFIHVAEESGLIVDMGVWILRSACSTLKRWMDTVPEAAALTVSVNISGRQFHEMDLVDTVSEILEETGLPARSLKLEVTETVVMADAHDSVHKMQRLKRLGVGISIDDFGTGYSSMSYLQKFSLDQLKVDLSFVKRIDVDPENIEIVRAMINLAHALRLEVVAEGIENLQQRNILYSLQCDHGQGYHFSRPVPEDEALSMVRDNRFM